MTEPDKTDGQDAHAAKRDGSPAPADDKRDAGEAFHDAMARVAELQEYIAYYVSAKTDAIKLSARKAIIAIALGLIGLLAVVAAVAAAMVMLLHGIAEAIGSALGRPWLGELIVGAGFFALLGIGAFVGVRVVTSGSRKKTVEKYESRKTAQRSRFGHHVN